ncbi:MAG: hypothetical protein QUS33_03410 [Dehalococcoidia bacterium]|nr:hypothetical protein [Dehalococcoidia bacterium]
MSIPLNCIDKGLLALHSKNEPMMEHCIVSVDGPVDPAKLRAALTAVLRRHPTWRSIIHAGLFRQVRAERDCRGEDVLSVWDFPTPHDSLTLQGCDIEEWHNRRLIEWMNRPLDPFREVPCRFLLLRRNRRGSTIVFTCHHSAADGLHLFRFAAEVIGEYNGGSGIRCLTACTAPDGGRDGLVALARSRRPKVTHFYLRILGSLIHRFLLAPFSPNTKLYRRSHKRSPEVGLCLGSLTPHELSQIRSRSKASGATINDALLAACFRAVQQWNDVHRKPTRKISIMVPVDIGGSNPSPLAGNQVSFISVSTMPKDRTDPDRLLRRLAEKTSHMLEKGIAFSIVYAARFCTLLSSRTTKCVADFLMVTRIYLDSILLTNLGVIWPKGIVVVEGGKLGDSRIASVVGIPPVVSPMGMSLCACTFEDHLYITLTYKSEQFSEAEAKSFLNLYLHELRGYQRTPEGLLAPEVRQVQARDAAMVN